MKYLENAIKFALKYYILIIPLYVLAVIPALISRAGAANALNQMRGIFNVMRDPMGQMQNPGALAGAVSSAAFASTGAGLLGFILTILAIPATYGLIKKAMDTGNATLNDIAPAISGNIVKYLINLVGTIVLWVLFGLAAVILGLLVALFVALIKPLGIFLGVVISIAILLAIAVISVLTSLWLPAMIVDNLDVMPALKKSFEVAKSSFWTILGITLLIYVISGVAGAIVGILNVIPLIGPIITSVIPAATGFVVYTFLMMLYREKTSGIAPTV